MALGHLRAGPCCLLQPPPRTPSPPSSFAKKGPELEPTLLPLVWGLELTLPQHRGCRPQNQFQTRERESARRQGRKKGKKKKKKGYASLPTQPKQSEGGERGGVKSQIRPLWLGPAPQMRPLPLPSGGSSYIWSCLTAAGLPAAFWAKSKPFPVHQRPSIT